MGHIEKKRREKTPREVERKKTDSETFSNVSDFKFKTHKTDTLTQANINSHTH